MIDPHHPFYRSLWLRVAIVVFTFAWAVTEFAIGSDTFGVIVGALGAYAAYMFFGPPARSKSTDKSEDRASEEEP